MDEIKDRVEGKAHELKGKVTGNKPEEVQGKAQQVKGKVEGAMNRAADNAGAEAHREDVRRAKQEHPA